MKPLHPLLLQPSTSTTYSVDVTSGTTTCQSDVTISVNPSPTVDLGSDVTICSGTTQIIDAGSHSSYLWNNGATTQTIDVNTSGTYHVTVQDANGCDASDTINTTVSPPITATVNSTTDVTCYNGNNGTANITISGGESPFSLSWNDTISDVMALWTLDDTSGNLVIDHSGNGTNATNQGATINQTGLYGRAYLFDGVDDIIEIPDNIQINLTQTSRRSYSFNFNASNVSNRQIIYEEGGVNNGYNIYILGGKLYFGAYSNGNNNWQGDWISYSISSNTWYSVVAAHTAFGAMKLYINGALGDSSFDTERVNSHTNPVGLGAKNGGTVYHDIGSSNGGGDNFGGYIDDFAIWNRMLTASEAADLASRSVIKSYTSNTVTSDGVYVANNLRAGNNDIVITDNSGCKITTNATITEPSFITGTDTRTACDSLVWINGNTYYADNNTEAHYLTAANGCDSIVILDLTIKAAPTVDLGNDVSICQGDSTLLDAGSGHTNYLWNTGETTQTIYADTAGTYNVTVGNGTPSNLGSSLSFNGSSTTVNVSNSSITGSDGFVVSFDFILPTYLLMIVEIPIIVLLIKDLEVNGGFNMRKKMESKF